MFCWSYQDGVLNEMKQANQVCNQLIDIEMNFPRMNILH